MNIEFKDNSKEVLSAEEMAVKKALEMIGIEAEKFAKQECPVDTGRLRNSITHAVDNEAVQIGTNVEYAFVQEDRKHFLRNSATNHSDLYKQIAEKVLKGG